MRTFGACTELFFLQRFDLNVILLEFWVEIRAISIQVATVIRQYLSLEVKNIFNFSLSKIFC